MGNNSADQPKPVALVARLSPLSTAETPEAVAAAQAAGEIRVADIPAAAWANVDNFRNGDNDPLEVVVETPVGKSKRGWNYRAQALQRVVDAVNKGGLPGFLGHQKPEDVSHQFPIPVTHWVGAKFDPEAPILDEQGQVVGKGKAYFRGIVDKAAENLKRWIRQKSITQTSIFGLPKLQRGADGIDVVDYDPLSIDWTPLGRAGMQTRIVALGEQVDITGPDIGEVLKDLQTDAYVIEDATGGQGSNGQTGNNQQHSNDSSNSGSSTDGSAGSNSGGTGSSAGNNGDNHSGSGDGSQSAGAASGTESHGQGSGSGSNEHSGGEGNHGDSSSNAGGQQQRPPESQRGSAVTGATSNASGSNASGESASGSNASGSNASGESAHSEGNTNQGGQGGHKVTVAEAVAALKEGRAKPEEVLGEMGWTPAEVLPVLKVDLPTAAAIIDKDTWDRLQTRFLAYGEIAGVFGLDEATTGEDLVARTKEAHTAEANVSNAEFNGRVSTILGEMVVNEKARPLVNDLVTPHLTKDMTADQIKTVVGEMLGRQSVKDAIGNLLEAGSQSPNGGQAHTNSSGSGANNGGQGGSNGQTNEYLRRKTVRVGG